MPRHTPPTPPPDLRLYKGKIHVRGIGDSNGQEVLDPRGNRLLGRYKLDAAGTVASSYGSTFTSCVLNALGVENQTYRRHGSARFSGLWYTTEWWVTPRQLAAIRAADAVIRELDPQRLGYDQIAERAVQAALTKMAE